MLAGTGGIVIAPSNVDVCGAPSMSVKLADIVNCFESAAVAGATLLSLSKLGDCVAHQSHRNLWMSSQKLCIQPRDTYQQICELCYHHGDHRESHLAGHVFVLRFGSQPCFSSLKCTIPWNPWLVGIPYICLLDTRDRTRRNCGNKQHKDKFGAVSNPSASESLKMRKR